MLPDALTRYFHDSRLVVESFAGSDNTLAVRIEKEIVGEVGLIVFRQVSWLSVTTAMFGESLRSQPLGEAGPEFWSRSRLDGRWFDADDVLFEIESQDGTVHFVIAKSLVYEVIAEPGAGAGGGT
jgi:hypothetical protein